MSHADVLMRRHAAERYAFFPRHATDRFRYAFADAATILPPAAMIRRLLLPL